MRKFSCIAAAVLALTAATASAQVAVFNFEDGTDQGFGTGFGNDASASFPIVNIGGSNRMGVANTASFQDAGREISNPADPAFLAFSAAATAESTYTISYDYYIDTSLTPGANGNFLQIATYVNTGSGYYAQDFPTTGKDVDIGGVALASGQVISGTVTETFSAKGFDLPPNGANPAPETFFRLGFIINGDGAGGAPTVYFDNIRVGPAIVVPEPTSIAAFGAAASLLVRRRRA